MHEVVRRGNSKHVKKHFGHKFSRKSSDLVQLKKVKNNSMYEAVKKNYRLISHKIVHL